MTSPAAEDLALTVDTVTTRIENAARVGMLAIEVAARAGIINGESMKPAVAARVSIARANAEKSNTRTTTIPTRNQPSQEEAPWLQEPVCDEKPQVA